MKMENIDKAIIKIEKGQAWDDADEVVELEVKKPLDKVIPIRLSAEKWELIRREAQELGIGPSTLARMWILEKLKGKTVVLKQTNSSGQLLASETRDRYDTKGKRAEA
jgi:hypothetical protein